MNAPTFRPRRSCLYMPASNPRALAKAKTLAADTIIFDLEDAVAPDAKEEAREQACAALQSGEYGNRELIVRINATDTPWFAQDLQQACRSKADAVLVPKILSADDIVQISDLMDAYDPHLNTRLWAMIEMPLAILNLKEIAALGAEHRLTTFVMGFNDLAKEMHAEQDRSVFGPVMTQAVIAARAYGLNIIDSVYNDFSDPIGLEAECLEAKKLGFDGKSLIHPAQIETANWVFAPHADAIAEAEAIIAAFNDPVNAGKGVIVVDGKMTELLHLKQAKQLVAIAEAIAAFGK
ncbi:HpcH/HpaI aldolase/citrate lyase family protein [Sphingorhabdus sp. M41]|uniref:HpcH/HpaI aldolase/citrate lyase family protein n=1 Tax=Sphingorhabdus sp. M41 TaxID=1806885 RepID=UPI00078D1B15|nr:CoA ester lyase [Sphingorhabdus sp. M41]AMO72117.1 malyl-CoA thiolesterase [Sphingorhabdus sp. M41]